ASALRDLHSFPTRRSSDLGQTHSSGLLGEVAALVSGPGVAEHRDDERSGRLFRHLVATQLGDEMLAESQEQVGGPRGVAWNGPRSEEHTSELQSRFDLVCR